tara:strand:- start:334 stop:531 length:198 start_codon:yes stop_codon:yes gene_type:complete
MSKCEMCSNGTTQKAVYICRENDYSIIDLNGNLLEKISDHDIPSGDNEINSQQQVVYCSCGKYWS